MHLCQIDVPGFDAARAFDSTRAFLLGRFPEILDVLPTTRAATLVIGYRGTDRVEAWAEALDEHRGASGARVSHLNDVRPGRCPGVSSADFFPPASAWGAGVR
jgi:hypothetical protein